MHRHLYIAFFCTLSCLITSYSLAPFVKNLGERFKILDLPNYRKVHSKPIVRIGGLSILISFFVCFFIIKEIFNFDSLSEVYMNSFAIILLGSFLFLYTIFW